MHTFCLEARIRGGINASSQWSISGWSRLTSFEFLIFQKSLDLFLQQSHLIFLLCSMMAYDCIQKDQRLHDIISTCRLSCVFFLTTFKSTQGDSHFEFHSIPKTRLKFCQFCHLLINRSFFAYSIY